MIAGVYEVKNLRGLLFLRSQNLAVQKRGKNIFFKVPPRLAVWKLLNSTPRVVDLRNYDVIFTEYVGSRRDSDSGTPKYEIYAIRIMKESWKKTVHLRFIFRAMARPLPEETFGEIVGFFKEAAPHLEIRVAPPPSGWGDDQRPWWNQWF